MEYTPDNVLGVTVREHFKLQPPTVVVGAEGPEVLKIRNNVELNTGDINIKHALNPMGFFKHLLMEC